MQPTKCDLKFETCVQRPCGKGENAGNQHCLLFQNVLKLFFLRTHKSRDCIKLWQNVKFRDCDIEQGRNIFAFWFLCSARSVPAVLKARLWLESGARPINQSNQSNHSIDRSIERVLSQKKKTRP